MTRRSSNSGAKNSRKKLLKSRAGSPGYAARARLPRDSIIAKAEEHLKDEKGDKRKLPNMRRMAEICGLQQDYLGFYSLFSEATHSGHIEVSGYMKPNAAIAAAKRQPLNP